MNGADLLTEYRLAGSERAFSELVRRYSNLVFSVARRRLGDGPQAEDATQTVFARLAKASPKVKNDGELAGWLHRTTLHVAIDLWRSETRRRTREQEAAIMQSTPDDNARVWDEVSPHLDEALDQLTDADRQAVLLRFFERKPMRDVGQVLGVSEDAAKMRVSRAIERLRHQLAARGAACTVVVLATSLIHRAVEAAPSHLAAGLSAMKLSTPAPIIGVGEVPALILHLARSKAALGLAALLTLAAVALALFGRPQRIKNQTTWVAAQTDPPPRTPSTVQFVEIAAAIETTIWVP